MKVMIAAGGTGGHFYPGLAVAKKLIQQGDVVHFIVRIQDKVIPWLEREKIPFSQIHAGGIARRFSLSLFSTLINNFKGLFESYAHLATNKPDVVLAMGGYLSFPISLAAWTKGIPVVLHEQNAVPGLANHWLSRICKKVAVTFPGCENHFGEKAVLVGNPIRPDFFLPMNREKNLVQWGLNPSKKTMLVFGGSLGAHQLNVWASQAIVDLKLSEKNWQVLHFTGEKDVEVIQRVYREGQIPSFVQAYCHEMPQAYHSSDVVISRSGASSISEIIVMKKPALLIPYPYATNQHQKANAQVLVSLGLALMAEEKDLNDKQMKEWIQRLIQPIFINSIQEKFSFWPLNFEFSSSKIRQLLYSIKPESREILLEK